MTARQPSSIAIRPSVIVVGVIFVGVPSVFGIFPEMTEWPLAVRFFVSLAWIGTVVGTIIVSGRRDSSLDRVMATADRVMATAVRQRQQLRLRATDDLLSTLLGERKAGLPDGYRFTVYVFDRESDLLLPVFPEPFTGPDDIRVFAPGCGAAGNAFQSKSLLLVTGDAVSDNTYGLTAAQQARWADYRSVVATPIWVDGERPIGVLSAISKSDDGSFDEPAIQARLREVADVIGIVLLNVSGEGVD